MTDITERLRLRTDPSQMLMSYPARPARDMLCYEAAAEIERLRAALRQIEQEHHVFQRAHQIAFAALAGEASDDVAT
jgi:hypothetical protein